jgi:hypothetical protein
MAEARVRKLPSVALDRRLVENVSNAQPGDILLVEQIGRVRRSNSNSAPATTGGGAGRDGSPGPMPRESCR